MVNNHYTVITDKRVLRVNTRSIKWAIEQLRNAFPHDKFLSYRSDNDAPAAYEPIPASYADERPRRVFHGGQRGGYNTRRR